MDHRNSKLIARRLVALPTGTVSFESMGHERLLGKVDSEPCLVRQFSRGPRTPRVGEREGGWGWVVEGERERGRGRGRGRGRERERRGRERERERRGREREREFEYEIGLFFFL